jgi:cobalt/nickel transport system permease protein
MPGIDAHILRIGALDRLAAQSTPTHRLDPRAKLVVTLIFILTVVSTPAHAPGRLLPFALYPVFLAATGNIPFAFLGQRLLLVSPFALMIGIWNPVFDRAPQAIWFGVSVSAGWISFIVILLRFFLTVGATLCLLAVTGMHNLCLALERLGVPNTLAFQLLMLYRYLFVLCEETLRLTRARSLRAFGGKGLGLASYAPLLGHLFLRTIARAERVYTAMRCRGFDGCIRTRATLRFRGRDLAFSVTWISFFILIRLWDIPLLLGRTILRYLSLS